MPFVSDRTIEGSVLLIGGRGGSDIGEGVGISSGIRSPIDSGSVAMSSADTDSGDNDGNTDDAAAIDDINDGEDIGEDDDPNTHLSHKSTTITLHGGRSHTKKEQRVMTEKFFKDSTDIVIFTIHVK